MNFLKKNIISQQNPEYRPYQTEESYRFGFSANKKKSFSSRINLLNSYSRLAIETLYNSQENNALIRKFLRMLSIRKYVITLKINLNFNTQWAQKFPNLFWSFNRYTHLRRLEVTLWSEAIKDGLILKSLKERFRNLDLQLCKFIISPLNDTASLASRIEFYEDLRSFHSITGLIFNISFKLHKKDCVFLAKALNSLGKLKLLSISITSNANDDWLIKFFNSLNGLNPDLEFEFDFNLKTIKDFAKVINSMRYVTKFFVGNLSAKNLNLLELKENPFIRDIEWNNFCFFGTNEDLMGYLKLNKKLINLRNIVISSNYAKDVNFMDSDFIPNENQIENVTLSLVRSGTDSQGLISISKQLEKIHNLKSLNLNLSKTKTTEDGFKSFFSCLKELRYLEMLSIDCYDITLHFYDFIGEESRLNTLKIFINDSGFKNIKPLSDAILHSELSVLNLHFNESQITDNEAKSLFEAIVEQKALKEIDLQFARCSKISKQNVQSLLINLNCNCSSKTIFNFNSINLFRIESPNVLKTFFNNPSLNKLCLDFKMSAANEGLESITKILRDSFYINDLSIYLSDDKKSISAKCLWEFSEALRGCKHMKDLSLGINKLYHINRREILPIFEAVRTLHKLRTLVIKLIIYKRNSCIVDDFIKSLLQDIEFKTVNNYKLY